jgi:hypothetical protein
VPSPFGLKNGVFWYRDEATYLRFREIIEDKERLASPYDAWAIKAQKVINDKAKQGVFLIKIKADPDEFIAWCKINSRPLDSPARMEFAMMKACEIVGSG